jgi:hypothetical protein
MEVSGRPSSGRRHWLTHVGGIIRVIFKLRARWAPNVGSQSPKYLTLDMRREKSVKVGMSVRENDGRGCEGLGS